MAKRRTGLQSQIASIFSGVPIPKKGGSGSEPPSTPPQAAGPERPQMKTPPASSAAPPKFQPPVEPVREIPPAKAAPRVPEPKIGQIPTVPRRKKEKSVAPRAGVVSSARQKVAVAMIAVLSILLVFLLARPSRKPAPGPSASGTTEAKAGVSSMTNIRIDWPVPQKYPESIRDPMILGSQREIRVERPGVLVVKAITYSEDVRVAVVGTEMLKEGDMVQGATIIKINLNSVEFEKDGKKWTQEVQGR